MSNQVTVAPVVAVEPTIEQLKAEIARLKLKNEFSGSAFKVTAKGSVSVYGLQRFPVTLTFKGWVKLLDKAVELRAFLEANKSRLYMGKTKEDAEEVAA